jgi:uncharacterized protein (TIRG00374 family)
MKNKLYLLAATFILGIIVFVLALKMTGLGNLLASFKNFSLFPLLAYLLIAFFMMAVSVYRWGVILKAQRFRIDFWKLFSYKVAGFSLCYITPGALLGGEVLRAYLLKRDKVPFTQGISSVIIDKFFDLASAAVIMSVGFLVVISFFQISNHTKAVFLLVTVAWVVILSFFLYGSLTRKGFFKHVFKFFQLHKIKSLAKVEKEIEKTEENISHFLINHKTAFRRCTVMSLVLWILMFAEYKIATVAFGYEASFVTVFFIIFMVGFSYSLPVPGALGVMEAAQASIHKLVGLKASQGIALSLLIRARDIIWTLLGVVFTYFHGVDMAKQISSSPKK